MDREQLVEALTQSFGDLRLSREERKSLHALLGPVMDENDVRFLRNRAFDLVRTRLADSDEVNWLHDVVKLLDQKRDLPNPSEFGFSPGPDCRQLISNAIRRAQAHIDVCVFTITDDQITHALRDAAARKVTVRVIADDDKSTDRGSDIQKLRDCGIPVVTDANPDHMHHKFALFDQTRLLTGSYNWTLSAWQKNYENLIVTSDAQLVQAFRTEFERLWGLFS